MVLIAGATGMLGGEICRLLREEGRTTRALVRSTSSRERVEELSRLGAETVEGDLRDRASLVRACRGARTVVSTASSMPTRYEAGSNDIASVDREGLIRLIDAAEAEGVERLLYISFTLDEPFPLRDAKRAVEKRLREGRMGYTILRPSYFMEVWLSPLVGFDYAKGSVRIFGSGDRPVSFVSYRDVARFAVACLESPGARNAELAVGGPEALTQRQVVRLFEEIAGHDFAIETVPESVLAAQLREASDPMQKSFSGLMHSMALGDAVDMSRLAKEYGISLRSVRDYAREVAAKARAA